MPEYFATGSNTFSITLKKGASQIDVDYGDLDMTDGLAGVSCGLFATGGIEPEVALRTVPNHHTINFNGQTAVYEWFTDADNDLANYSLKYNTVKHKLSDVYENNDSFGAAAAISLPFNTAPNNQYTDIYPAAADIDFFRFNADAGQTLVAEVTRGQIDSVMGLFDSTGTLIAFNDDANGLLSAFNAPIPATGTYTLAVTFCCDYDFDGVDPGEGYPLDVGRYVLDLQLIDGVPLTLGDDDYEQVPIGFSFPFQGSNYTDVFVNSNGSLTFGGGDTDYTESVGEFLGGLPRIAPLWDDLSPNQGGQVLVKASANSLKVTFSDVPEFLASTGNSFAVTLFDSGDVTIDYGSVASLDSIVGVTEGGGAADPGETNLSAGGPFSATGTTYEQFTGALDPFDLGGGSLDFSP